MSLTQLNFKFQILINKNWKIRKVEIDRPHGLTVMYPIHTHPSAPNEIVDGGLEKEVPYHKDYQYNYIMDENTHSKKLLGIFTLRLCESS